MSLRDENLDVIVAALLAVNNFPLLRAQELVPRLRELRLLDADHVSALGLETVTQRLVEAGYNRGPLTSMFATRLQSLLCALRDGKLRGLEDAVRRNDEANALKTLTSVKGIGPVVGRTAWLLLRAITSNSKA